MIPIRKSNIEDLAKEHYYAIKKHFDTGTLKYSYSEIDQWFRSNGLRWSFKDIVLAKPNDLSIIARHYSPTNQQINSLPNKIKYIRKTLYTSYFAKSSEYLKGTNYNASKLVKNLDMTVCPYCNRNYINNVSYKNKGFRRTSQVDHFHSASKYPFLAMSFFNLVPSCASCNHLKSNKEINYSPYDEGLDSHNLFHFKTDPKTFVDIHDKNQIKVKLENIHAKMKSNLDVLCLESQYEIHRDLIQELILKKRMYSEKKLRELKDDFKDLFENDEEFNRTIFGNYLEEKDFYKRPLSKMTSDIVNELVYLETTSIRNQ